MALLPLAGCRPSLDLCVDGCGDAGAPPQADGETAGAGGRDAAGGSPTDSAGDGGSDGGATPCKADADCADDLRCNGDEQCKRGVCVAGSLLSCNAGTSCDESDAGEPCRYAVPSPWLVLLGIEKIWGLPTAELGKRELIELGERASTGIFSGMNAIDFSPDGSHAFVDFLAQDFGQAVLELSFGRGLPEPAHDLPNLPNWGNYSTPVISRDGKRGLVSEFGTGPYLLDLASTPTESLPLDMPTFAASDVAFCSDDRTWLRKSPETTLYTGGLAQPEATVFGSDYDNVELSPDARKIWLGGDSPRLVACSSDAKTEPLEVVADSARFSPDSRFLLLSLADGTTKLLSVAESLLTTELWSGSDVVGWTWPKGGESLVLQLESDDTSSYGFLDLSQAQPLLQVLALDGASSLLDCHRDACVARGPALDDTRGPLLLQPLHANAKPVEIGADTRTANVVLADLERNRLLVQRDTANGYELTLADFEGTPERHLFDWASGSIVVEPATDDSGVLIRIEDNIEFSSFWVAFPGEAAEATVVLLDVGSHDAVFQPWP